jgi:hypothetical protein
MFFNNKPCALLLILFIFFGVNQCQLRRTIIIEFGGGGAIQPDIGKNLF